MTTGVDVPTTAGASVEVSANERAYRARLRRRRHLVHVVQLAFLLVVLGGWQMSAVTPAR